MKTLSEAKEYLKDNYKDGCICPTCNQFVKLYKRALTSSMAYGLILLYKSNKTDYFHIENYLKEQDCPSSIRGDISKLCHFGLLQRQEGKKEDGNPSSGHYKLTDKARAFVMGKITVPKHVNIYNKIVYGYSENHTNIKGALKKKFNYNELLNN